MSVWYHLSTIKLFWNTVHKLCTILSVIVLSTILFLSAPALASPSNEVVNFSARLKGSGGAVVDDGFYNIEFKLYNQQSGGEALWTETYSHTETDNRVEVINGHFNVKLGSIQNFNSINWNENLWLTMNIGGTEVEITPEDWDGEMNPRIQLTAVPYAMNANRLGGKTLEEILQLGQGMQNDSTNQASIAINKTGSGDLMHLQSNGNDAFKLSQTGSITMGGSTDQSITLGESDSGIGHNLTIAAGSGSDLATNNNGGNLVLQGGSASGVEGKGGDVVIDTGTGIGGEIAIGADNANQITIGNQDSTTTVEGQLEVDTIDTATEGALEVGGENTTEINLNKDTNIEGDLKVNSSIDSGSAFQIQNSANSSILNVSTSGGNILTLGSGGGGIGYIDRATSGSYGGELKSSEQTSTLNKDVAAGNTLIGSISVAHSEGLSNLSITDNRGNIYTVDASTTNSTDITHYIFSSRITTPLEAGDIITLSIGSALSDRWAWNVEQFDNIVISDRLDKTSANSGNGTSMTSGQTTQTVDDHQLVFSGFGYNGTNQPIIVSDDLFSSSPQKWTEASSDNHGNFVQWRYAKTAGVESSSVDTDSTLDWTAIAVTYRTLGAPSTAGSLGLASAGGFTGSLNTSSLTADRTYTLPDESGVICLQDSPNCGFVGLHSEAAQEGSIWLTGGAKLNADLAVRTAEDSEQALQIQNSQGVNQLTVDTANSIVKIGNGDTSTTTLLALDTKQTEGDPVVGTDGAMYYNAHLGSFRCFVDEWKDCITPLPVSVTTKTATDTIDGDPIDIEDLNFTLVADTKYYYKFVLVHESEEETTGVGFGVTTPNSPVMNSWCVNTSSAIQTANPTTAGHWGSYCGMQDANATTTGEVGRGTNFTSTMEGYIETGDEGGELKLRMKSEHLDKITTVNEGSFGILQIVQ